MLLHIYVLSATLHSPAHARTDTHRDMRCFMVHVYECSLDIRQYLDPILELLTKVMSLPKWSVCVHHHIYLDEVVRPALYTSHRQSTKRNVN